MARRRRKVVKTMGASSRLDNNLFNSNTTDSISQLDGPQLVQSMAKQGFLLSSAKGKGFPHRDYTQEGNYLGRVTIDEGDIIDMELV